MNRILSLTRYPEWVSFILRNYQKIFQAIVFLLSLLISYRMIMTFSTAQVILILALVFFLYVVVKKPEIGILAMFALIASLLYKQAIPAIPIGSISLLVTDVILFVLLLRIPYKALTDRSFRFLTTPLDVPLLLFIFASFISAGVAILKYGQDFSVIVGTGLQMIIYYLLFFVITNFIREKKQIRFLFGSLLGIATFVSLAMIIQAKVAGSVRLMYGRIESVGQGSWAARILPPGEVVVFIMFISAVCAMAIINKPFFSTVYLYLIPLLGGGMLLTYNRQYWGAIIFSFFVFMVVSTNRGKKRFLSWLAIVFVSVILIVLPLSRLSKTGRVYSDSIMERFSSLLTVKETYVSDRSLGWRKIENQYAWRSIVRHPLLGIGLFTAYRPPLPGMDIGEDGWDSKRFIHNGYLWVLVNMGLLGFLPLMWLYIRFLTRGFSNWRKIMDPMEKSIVIGYAICGVALSLSILFEPRVLQWRGIMVIATMAGMNEAIILRNEKECRENDMFKEVTHE